MSELKQSAIFSGFASLNDHVDQRTAEFNQQAEKTDRMLARIGEEAAASLKELESHYYSSAERIGQTLQLLLLRLQEEGPLDEDVSSILEIEQRDHENGLNCRKTLNFLVLICFRQSSRALRFMDVRSENNLLPFTWCC